MPKFPAVEATGEESRAAAAGDGQGSFIPIRESGPGLVRAKEAEIRIIGGNT